MIEHPTLYVRDSNKSIRFWFLEQEDEKYRSVSGVLGTTNPIRSGWQIAESKNVGKINKTSPIEQAQKEIISEYTKKQSLGYVADKDSVDIQILFEPMLAKPFDLKKISWKHQNYIQPKMDGVRCVALSHGLFSRNGKSFDSVPHIAKILEPVFKEYPDLVLDGELYNHILRDDFNKIISLVRKQKPEVSDLKLSEKMIQYHIYDCFLEQGFGKRYELIKNIVNSLSSSSIVLVPTFSLSEKDSVDDWHSKFTEDNFEGAMIRLGNMPYENKRSFQLMKLKNFIDQEFKVLRIEEGTGNRTGMAGKIICQLNDGREFGAGIKGSHDYSRQLLKNCNNYINGTATVRYFNLTPDGIPRFPVCVAIFDGERDI